MGFRPLPVGGRGERFGARTSRNNKRVKGGTKEGGEAWDGPLNGGRRRRGEGRGVGILKGKREDVRRSLGETDGEEREREMSIIEFEEKDRGRRTEEGGRERSRALSCRPGSQIRRGLKRGVDCV